MVGLSAETVEDKPIEGSSYVIHPNDVVALSVFNEPSLTTQTRVLQTGEAMFPLLGPVRVTGLALSDAMEKLRALYDADYLVDPILTLTVEEYAVRQILVLGAVQAAGQIPVPSSGTLDLAAAIAAAGGMSPSADPNRISLVRADGSTASFTVSALERGIKVQLSPGDRITVMESRFAGASVTFIGQVGRPGAVAFPVNGDLDIVTAVAQAGGLTQLANPRRVSINRKGRVIVLDVREMSSRGATLFKLEPDDIITVPERIF